MQGHNMCVGVGSNSAGASAVPFVFLSIARESCGRDEYSRLPECDFVGVEGLIEAHTGTRDSYSNGAPSISYLVRP